MSLSAEELDNVIAVSYRVEDADLLYEHFAVAVRSVVAELRAARAENAETETQLASALGAIKDQELLRVQIADLRAENERLGTTVEACFQCDYSDSAALSEQLGAARAENEAMRDRAFEGPTDAEITAWIEAALDRGDGPTIMLGTIVRNVRLAAAAVGLEEEAP